MMDLDNLLNNLNLLDTLDTAHRDNMHWLHKDIIRIQRSIRNTIGFGIITMFALPVINYLNDSYRGLIIGLLSQLIGCLAAYLTIWFMNKKRPNLYRVIEIVRGNEIKKSVAEYEEWKRKDDQYNKDRDNRRKKMEQLNEEHEERMKKYKILKQMEKQSDET